MKRYQVSPHFKYTLIVAIAGFFFLALYLFEMLRFWFPTEVNELNARLLKEDQYVVIRAQECLTFGNENASSGTVTMMKDFRNFVFRLGNHTYLRAGLYEKRLIDQIENWKNGKGTSAVEFFGKVKYGDIDFAKLDTLSGFHMEDLVEQVYILQVTQKEVQTQCRILLLLGGGGLILAFVLFFSFAGIRAVYVRPFEDSKRYKDFVLGRNYRLEEELAREKNVLENIKIEQKEYKDRIWHGVAMVVARLIGTIYFGMLYAGGEGLALVILLISFYGGLYGMNWLWHAFVNSDLPLAQRISDQFLLRTCSVRREESSKVIHIITQKLEEAKNNKNEKEEKAEPFWYGPGVWEQPDQNGAGGVTDESDLIK